MSDAAASQKYAYAGDGSRWSVHAWMIRLVGREKRVLDIGCATGYLAERFARNGCRVTGIEMDPAAAEEARRHCERVIVGGADQPGTLESAGGGFDVIVCGDVLEHMAAPERALTLLRKLLVPGGSLLVSLPNVAYARVRLDLLRGRFEYQETGILDRTHLRFFTRHSARRLFAECGWMEREFHPAADRRPYLAARLWPTLLAPQFVFRLIPVDTKS